MLATLGTLADRLVRLSSWPLFGSSSVYPLERLRRSLIRVLMDTENCGLAETQCLSSGACFGAKHTRTQLDCVKSAGFVYVYLWPLLISLSLQPTKNWSTNNLTWGASLAIWPAVG